MSDLVIRPFASSDVPAITAIYAHYVDHSTATFDLEAPDAAVMADKFGQMATLGHPVVVAEREGKMLGYGYASTYRPRRAYRFTSESTVYCAPDAQRQGVGSALMHEVIAGARDFGFKQMLAVITAEGTGSIGLHKKLGFREVGRYEAVGLKFDRWLDVVHMQKAL